MSKKTALILDVDGTSLDTAPLFTDSFHKALATIGIAAQDAAYIGDTKSDMLAAHAAGVTAIGVAWSDSLDDLKSAHPHHIIQTFSELLNFI